jgi:hypothetical protein
MDFKSLLNKIDSVQTRPETPAAPELPKAVQLNEDAQLRVLSGRTTYVAEAKKKAEEEVAEEMKVGDKKNIATGTVEKTKTGIIHKSNKAYGGSEEKADDSDDAPKSKKKSAKKESIDFDADEFRADFNELVEAKKKGGKPDFLDMDKDGDKKEPMKKAVADKKKGAAPKKGVNPFAKKDEDVKEAAEKTATTWTDKSGKKHPATKVKGDKYTGKEAEKDDKKKTDESKMMPKGKKRPVKESVEQKLSFKEMMKLVIESGGQQQIDPVDQALFNWAQRVASSKFTESAKAEIFAGLIYERNGGVFEMYDVLSETK